MIEKEKFNLPFTFFDKGLFQIKALLNRKDLLFGYEKTGLVTKKFSFEFRNQTRKDS